MTEKSTPVLVYRPQAAKPVLAGIFSWSPETRIGKFEYHADFMAHPDSRSLDPVNLRFQRRAIKEAKQDGIFGVFRDAGPDAWGRSQLFRRHGELDEFAILLKGPGDGVGNIVFGETENAFRAFTLDEIDQVSRGFPPEDSSLEEAINPTTSMGGAKPKLLVELDGAYWIAKFPERGDPLRFLAANEHVMLQMAANCGIQAAESRLHPLPDGRQILLVRRFDLDKHPDGLVRRGFASAHTLLGLGNPREDGQRKSYLRFAEEARRWCGVNYNEEIWQRVVFNAMVGNTDDHARNHALIMDQAGWKLSPAFDIVAYAKSNQVALRLRFFKGGSVATPESLLASSAEFGIEHESAVATLRRMAEVILESWRPALAQVGAEPENIDALAGAFKVAQAVREHPLAPAVAIAGRSRRYKR